MDELYLRLAALARRFGAKRLVLFGSRARGDNRPNSLTQPLHSFLKIVIFFMQLIHQLYTILFNVCNKGGIHPVLHMDNIKFQQRGQVFAFHPKFCSVVWRHPVHGQIHEALDDYKKYPLDSVRDGAIQRFEFCTELAWKTMREYLLDQGYTNINSPKEVIKQAFAFGMIEDSKVWLELLNDRNLTSHIYDEATARAIFDRIESQYLPLFDKALAYMQE